MKRIEDIYWQTKIWKHFEEFAKSDNVETVRKLVVSSVYILDRIVETFPTYTLHNGQHQLNILNLYGDLLGAKMSDLSDLESAILILSAFYHDIGMVYTEEERNNLQKEDLFEDFISSKPGAKLAFVQNDNEVNLDLAEWYCRWAHAKRVWKYLDEINEYLIWDNTSIRKQLAHVCLSHNEDTSYIESPKIPFSFWNDSDLKFCAILLRLADILDFDNSRSPESVFKFLGLDLKKTSREAVSHDEWSKHLASNGFDFRDWSANNSYIIYFNASPKHPAVENDIHEFLNIIDNELQKCSFALRSCSNRWRDFKLPEKINRNNIISQGYTYGAFKFRLDQRQVLNLLMGENLYSNPYVFIREILQNSIDTTRHRLYHEQSSGNLDYEVSPIKITDWRDSEGYKWIRFDDYGMGMTKTQITKYFLNVGNSYYNSDEFKISKFDYANVCKSDFTPVSRFGIGILSCFLVSDLIEVSTKSIYTENKNENKFPIRLILNGVNSHYFLYANEDIPKSMPNEEKDVERYRKEPGTSIAIRLNSNFDRENFNINNILKKLIYGSQVPVKYGDKVYGINRIEDLPIENKVYKLPERQIALIKWFMKDVPIKKLNTEIHFVPCVLRDEKVDSAEGVFFNFLLRKNIIYGESLDFHDKYAWYLRYSRDVDSNRLELKIERDSDKTPEEEFRAFSNETHYDEFITFSDEFIKIDLTHQILNEFYRSFDFTSIRNILISYNGIILPRGFTEDRIRGRMLSINFNLHEKKSNQTLTFGMLMIKDRLRPNLNIARNAIKSMPWKFYSEINYLVRRSLKHSEYSFDEKIDYLSRTINNIWIIVEKQPKDLLSDKFIMDKEYWAEELRFGDKGLRIDELDDTEINIMDERSGARLIKKVVVDRFTDHKIRLFKVKIRNWRNEVDFKLVGKMYVSRKVDINVNMDSDVPPLMFSKYENFSGLLPLNLSGISKDRYKERYIDKDEKIYNIEHRFSKWLISVYRHLFENYSYHLGELLNAKNINQLNKILHKLKSILDEKLKPDFLITKEDLKVDWDSLEEIENPDKKYFHY